MANKVGYIIQLQDKFSAVSRKVKRAATSLNTSVKKLGFSVDKLRAKLKSASKGLAKVGATATAVATVPIVLLGKSMLEAASDAVETQSKFNQVFSDVEKKANSVSTTFAKSFGVADSTAQDLIGSTGDLLVGFGFTGDAALQISKDVNELAADLASFQNLEGGTARASEALTKALLGETESAKSLGIVIRQTTPLFKAQIKAVMRARGITKQQAKAVVILNIAQKQSSKAIGDVNRTFNDYANVSRRAGESTKKLTEDFGRKLLPIATKILIKITSLVDWMSGLSDGTKTVILGVAAFLAVGGPLLILLSGIAVAMSVINAPFLIFIGLAAAVAAIAVVIISNWDGIKESVGGVIDFLVAKIKVMLAPLIKAKEILESIGTRIFGDGSELTVKSAPALGRTQTDVNVNLRAPVNTIESVKSRSSGRGRGGMNVGVNMEATG